METFDLSASFLSLLSVGGLFTMALVSLFAVGPLSKKLGDKLTCITGLLIMVISGVLYILIPQDSIAALVVIRLLQGVGMGITNPTAMALEAVWFPKKERALSAGLMSACYGLAMTLVTQYTYFTGMMRWSVGLAAGVMLISFAGVMVILVALVYKDINKKYGVNVIDEAIEGYEPPAALSDKEQIEKDIAAGKKVFAKPGNLKEAIRFPGFWLMNIGCFCYASVLMTGLNFVLPLYFPGFGYDAATSTAILSWTFLGHLISSPIFGIISDRVLKGRRTEMTMVAFWGGAALWILFHVLILNNVAVSALTVVAFFAYFVVTGASGVYYVLPVEICQPKFSTRSMSIALVFANVGGITSQLVCGALMNGGNVSLGMYYYSCTQQ